MSEEDVEGDMMEESEEETEEGSEATGSQQQQRKSKKGRKAAAPGPNPCLGCQKNCTRAQHSVRCTLCELWCHRNCAGLSEEAFKGLEIQQRETGTAFWACRSCLGYAKKVNNQLKKVDERIDNTDKRVDENEKSIKETQQLAQETARQVKSLASRMDRMVDEMEEKLDTELREREVRRQNIIIHGLDEVSDTVSGNRERMEADKQNCEAVFRALGARTGANNIRFCRRIGERGRTSRPLVVGLNSEGDKNFILSRAKNLLNTDFYEVAITPDLTKRQRAGEVKLKEEADRRNHQLTQQDIDNNMRWLVVGRKGEKRLIKGVERDFTRPIPQATYSQAPQPNTRQWDRPTNPRAHERPGQAPVGTQSDPQQYAPDPHAPHSRQTREPAYQHQPTVPQPGTYTQYHAGPSQAQAAGPQLNQQQFRSDQIAGPGQVQAAGPTNGQVYGQFQQQQVVGPGQVQAAGPIAGHYQYQQARHADQY